MPIRLKAILLKDLEAFHEQLSDPLVAYHCASVPSSATLAFAKERLIKRAAEERLQGTIFQRGVYDGETLVGSGVLSVTSAGEWEIGYFIGSAYREKGYATEAAQALVKLARQLGPERPIIARYGKDNPASGKILEKLGFVFDSEEMVKSVSRGVSFPSIKVRLRDEPKADGVELTDFDSLADIEWVYSLNEDPEALLMAGIAGDVVDKAQFVAAMKADLAAPEKGSSVYLIRKDGQRAGYIDLSPTKAGEMVLGYWVHRDFWGQGVAGRAVALLLLNLPEELRTEPLYARVLDGNEASIRILEKLGFVAIARNSYYSGPHKGDVQQTIFRR